MNVNPRAQAKWRRNALLAFSAIALNHAVLIAEGLYSPLAMRWLLIAGLALMLAVFGPPIQRIEELREKPVLVLLAGGLALQFFELLRNALESFSRGSPQRVAILFIAGFAARSLLTRLSTPGLGPPPEKGTVEFSTGYV